MKILIKSTTLTGKFFERLTCKRRYSVLINFIHIILSHGCFREKEHPALSPTYDETDLEKLYEYVIQLRRDDV